jgi:hypothetical protein
LGISLGHAGNAAEIFVPSLGRSILIDVSQVHAGEPKQQTLYFETADCSGVPYTWDDGRQGVIIASCGKYFVGLEGASITAQSQCRAYHPCEPYTGANPLDVSQGVEIPVEDIPFTLPVTLPLQYEVQ